MSNKSGRPYCHARGASKAAKKGIGGLGNVFGMTTSSGAAYRGSSIPYSGLKLIPVARSHAAPKSIILIWPCPVMRIFSGLISL